MVTETQSWIEQVCLSLIQVILLFVVIVSKWTQLNGWASVAIDILIGIRLQILQILGMWSRIKLMQASLQ